MIKGMYCDKCGETLNRLLIFALMIECGARCGQSPSECRAGGEHHFVIPKEEKDTFEIASAQLAENEGG